MVGQYSHLSGLARRYFRAVIRASSNQLASTITEGCVLARLWLAMVARCCPLDAGRFLGLLLCLR